MFKKGIDYAHLISSGREQYGENKYEDSIEDFNKAIELNPKEFISYKGRASAKRKLRDIEGADEDDKK